MQELQMRYALQPPSPKDEEYAATAAFLVLCRIDMLPPLKDPKGYSDLCPALLRQPQFARTEGSDSWDQSFEGSSAHKAQPTGVRNIQLKALRTWLSGIGAKISPKN